MKTPASSRARSASAASVTPPGSPASPEDHAELALRGFLSSQLWAGRTVIEVRQAACALQVSEQHVMNLIRVGRLRAINIGNGLTRRAEKRGYWRIPASAWDAFVRENATGKGGAK
jgi:hypothetical protein